MFVSFVPQLNCIMTIRLSYKFLKFHIFHIRIKFSKTKLRKNYKQKSDEFIKTNY